MTNKYLTKICALLKAPADKPITKKKGKQFMSLDLRNKSKTKIKKHNGDTIYRTHKVK
jgi:hypothetical protein